MEYWRGRMNWPVEQGWKCEICGHDNSQEPVLILWPALTWGLVHGECRCDLCHAHYYMGTVDDKLTTPLLLMQVDWVETAKYAWKAGGGCVDTWSDRRWLHFRQKMEKEHADREHREQVQVPGVQGNHPCQSAAG